MIQILKYTICGAGIFPISKKYLKLASFALDIKIDVRVEKCVIKYIA